MQVKKENHVKGREHILYLLRGAGWPSIPELDEEVAGGLWGRAIPSQ